MRIRTLFAATVAVAALGATALAAPAGASASAGPTLADILEAQGGGTDRNWYDFDILAAGVDAAGLTAALDDPSADLTVFIPNDRAFQALVADLFGFRYWFASEATILNKLVQLETSAPGTLQTVILYHAVPGQIPSSAALSVPRGTELTTLQGGKIKVYPIKWLRTAVLVDQDRNDVDPFLVKSKLDIQASNGIAHGISFVLRPANL
jgi:uncharacterized surface protein with fasciclin (FAS1) repeats